jgi:hypothetical protein
MTQLRHTGADRVVALLAGGPVWRRCFCPIPNEVIALPRDVDQDETERLGRA